MSGQTAGRAPRILLAGGYGLVGALVARLVAKHHPQVELLIGGRHLAKGAALAREIGNASAVALDMNASSPLAAIEGRIDAVFCLVHDSGNNMLTDCIARGIAYGDITRGPAEQFRAYVSASLGETRAPVLFAANWMAGVPAILAMHMTEGFSRIDAIDLSLLFYEADRVGPDSSSAGSALSERFIARIDGGWQSVQPMSDGRRVRFPSGLTRNVYRMNMGDVTTLAQASNAANIAVRLGLDGSGTMTFMRMMMKIGLWPFIAKLAGQPGSKPGKGAPHEIVIEVAGMAAGGRTLAKRAALIDRQGQAHLTALGALVGLEAIAGLGRPQLRPGIAIPETAPDAARLIALLTAEGVDLRFE